MLFKVLCPRCGKRLFDIRESSEGTVHIKCTRARSAGISAIASAGGKVTMYGIAFDRSDIDALFDIAKHQIGE